MIKPQAELFLEAWGIEYENSEGEISEPDFSEIEKNYSDVKTIPHYVFDDGSTIIEIRNSFGRVSWEACESESELDEEYKMSWGLNNCCYEIQDVFNKL